MKNKCKNYAYEECDNDAEKCYDGFCSLCAEAIYNAHVENLMEGGTYNLKEQMREAQKVK